VAELRGPAHSLIRTDIEYDISRLKVLAVECPHPRYVGIGAMIKTLCKPNVPPDKEEIL
jgi:hypothetical protein